MGEPVSTIRLQGVLEKRGKFTGVLLTRKYLCTLENGLLKYRKDGEKEKGLDIVSVQYIRPGRDCSFEIVTQSSTHIFVAGSVSERDDWVKALRESMGTTSLRLPSVSNRFTAPRSYSEDSAALYEAIADSPKLTSKFPRSLTLSVNSAKNKSQKWLSINPYETLNDPPDVVPVMAFLDSPPKISTDDKVSVSPQAVRDLYESIQEDRNNLVIYEGDMDEGSSLNSLPVSDEPPVESDLYAYACADDVRKVVLKDKPKLCNEYSTVHDSRCSELLYSEVGIWDGVLEHASSKSGEAVCGLATVVEATDGMKPGNDSFNIYQLAKDPDAIVTENQSQLPVEDCRLGIKTSSEETTRRLPETPKLSGSTAVLSKSLKAAESYTKTASDNGAAELSNSQNRTVGLKAQLGPKECSVVYSKVEKPHCGQFPQKSLPSPPLPGNRTVLESSVLDTQVVTPSSNLYAKVVKPPSNDAFFISHSTSESLSSFPLAGGSTTFPESGASDDCSKVVKLDTNNPTLSNSVKGSSCSKTIPKLPNPRISSKHQSPFDEMRTVVGETWEHKEVDELQSKGTPRGANAVDELRQFLQKLEK